MIYKNKRLEEIIDKNGLDIDEDEDLAIAKTTYKNEENNYEKDISNIVNYEINTQNNNSVTDEPFFNIQDEPSIRKE